MHHMVTQKGVLSVQGSAVVRVEPDVTLVWILKPSRAC